MMRFYTLYWVDGRRQFLSGESLVEAQEMNNISESVKADILYVKEGFDFELRYAEKERRWKKNHWPVGQVDISKIVVNGLMFPNFQETKDFLKDHHIRNAWIGGRVYVATGDLKKIFRLLLDHLEA